jgi:excisionase family DNA binding protein
MESLLLRVPEAAQLLGLGRTTTYDLIARGEIPVVRVGRAVRVPREALVAWIASRREAPVSGPVGPGSAQ